MSGPVSSSAAFATVVILFTITTLLGTVIFAERVVEVNPSCGPAEPGFNVYLNVNGFQPDSTVKWNLVDSQDQIPLYGYFQVNGTGGFNDVTFMDDVRPDNYKMNFAVDDDLSNPYVDSPRLSVDITIPCAAGQEPGPSIATADYRASDVVLLSQRLKTGDGAYDNIVGEVKNIGNETAKSVRIGLTAYDDSGDVIGTDSTYSTADTLNSGQKSSFNLLSSKDNFDGMKYYELSLQWQGSDGTKEYVDNAQVFKDRTGDSD